MLISLLKYRQTRIQDVYKRQVIQDIKDDFIQTMEYCRQIEPEFCLNRNIGLRIMQNIFLSLIHISGWNLRVRNITLIRKQEFR